MYGISDSSCKATKSARLFWCFFCDWTLWRRNRKPKHIRLWYAVYIYVPVHRQFPLLKQACFKPSPIRLHLLCIPTAATFLFRFTMIASRVAMIMIHIEILHWVLCLVRIWLLFKATASLLNITDKVPEQHIRHLQILHDVQVEAKICALLPQMDNWLDGTLPLSDQPRHDFGIIVPSVDVDRPLIPVRDLLYKGVIF